MTSLRLSISQSALRNFVKQLLVFLVFLSFSQLVYTQNDVTVEGDLKVLGDGGATLFTVVGPSGEFRLNPWFGAGNGTTLLGYFDGRDFASPQIRFVSDAHPFVDVGLDGAGAFTVENLDITVFKIDTSGNAVIGLNAPQAAGYTLSVGGKIASEEILVDLSDDWPDYVFKKEYHLLSLTELKKHINANGHLPGLPAAEDVQDVGIELGEMNRLLVEKIEELTLYILQQDERIIALEEKVNK